MSNRSYVIVLSEQTFMHSWHISTQTFVNSVSNKHHSWTHTHHRVKQTHSALPLTKARIGLERQRQTRAVWAKRTEYSIEQIRQSLQRLKIAKIVRMQNLHNFQTIDSVFFSDTRLRYKLSIIDQRLSQTHMVGHSSRCTLTRSRSSKPPFQSRRPQLSSWHMSNYSYVVSATCRHRLFPLCYES